VQPRNLALEAQTLQEIAQWAVQFLSMLSITPNNAVLLEIGAGLKLFAGLEMLLATIRTGLITLGLSATVTAGGPDTNRSTHVRRAGQAQAITAVPQLEHALASLPVDSLVYAEHILETWLIWVFILCVSC